MNTIRCAQGFGAAGAITILGALLLNPTLHEHIIMKSLGFFFVGIAISTTLLRLLPPYRQLQSPSNMNGDAFAPYNPGPFRVISVVTVSDAVVFQLPGFDPQTLTLQRKGASGRFLVFVRDCEHGANNYALLDQPLNVGGYYRLSNNHITQITHEAVQQQLA